MKVTSARVTRILVPDFEDNSTTEIINLGHGDFVWRNRKNNVCSVVNIDQFDIDKDEVEEIVNRYQSKSLRY